MRCRDTGRPRPSRSGGASALGRWPTSTHQAVTDVRYSAEAVASAGADVPARGPSMTSCLRLGLHGQGQLGYGQDRGTGKTASLGLEPSGFRGQDLQVAPDQRALRRPRRRSPVRTRDVRPAAVLGCATCRRMAPRCGARAASRDGPTARPLQTFDRAERALLAAQPQSIARPHVGVLRLCGSSERGRSPARAAKRHAAWTSARSMIACNVLRPVPPQVRGQCRVRSGRARQRSAPLPRPA